MSDTCLAWGFQTPRDMGAPFEVLKEYYLARRVVNRARKNLDGYLRGILPKRASLSKLHVTHPFRRPASFFGRFKEPHFSFNSPTLHTQD